MYSPLSKIDHAGMGYENPTPYLFAKNQTLIDLLDEEITRALEFFPLVFRPAESTKEGEQRFALSVLTSLQPSQNWAVHSNGKWLLPYVPALLRGYPFILASAQDDQEILCVRSDEAHFQPSENNAILDSEGEMTEKGQALMSFLTKAKIASKRTQAKVDALSQAGLVEPWDLKIKTTPDAEPTQVQGLFKVNVQALQSIDAETAQSLIQSDAMSLAYAQLFAQKNIQKLTQLLKVQNQLQANSVPNEPLFESDKKDEIEFDFGE